MWLDAEKIKEVCAANGISLRTLLRKAGVSRSAYYHLIQSPTLIPASIHKISQALNISVRDIVTSGTLEEEQYRCRLDRLDMAMRQYPKLNRENVWHALVLLELEPIERLRGALRRASR